MKYVEVSMIYFHSNFYMHSTNYSLVKTTKLKAKESFCESVMTIYILNISP